MYQMKRFYDFEAWYTKNVNTRGLYLVLKTFIPSIIYGLVLCMIFS